MPISFVCSGCDGKLKAKDESAGKRIKCPRCETIVSVPKPQSRADQDDFLGSLGEAVRQERRGPRAEPEEIEDFDPPPKRRSKTSSPRKPSKKRNSGSSDGSVRKRIFGGLAGVIVFIAIIGNIGRITGVISPPVEWREFRHPNGGALVLMPGTPKVRTEKSHQGQVNVYMCETGGLACSLVSERLPPDSAGAVAANPAAVKLVLIEMKLAATKSSSKCQDHFGKRNRKGWTLRC